VEASGGIDSLHEQAVGPAMPSEIKLPQERTGRKGEMAAPSDSDKAFAPGGTETGRSKAGGPGSQSPRAGGTAEITCPGAASSAAAAGGPAVISGYRTVHGIIGRLGL
jgi:hypothetical protein